MECCNLVIYSDMFSVLPSKFSKDIRVGELVQILRQKRNKEKWKEIINMKKKERKSAEIETLIFHLQHKQNNH